MRKTPVICTRDTRGNAASITCTETQSRNERRVGGWPGGFWTACGRDHLRAVACGTLTVTTLPKNCELPSTNRSHPDRLLHPHIGRKRPYPSRRIRRCGSGPEHVSFHTMTEYLVLLHFGPRS